MAADLELDVEAFADALTGEEDGRRLLVLEALQECDRRAPLPDVLLVPLLDCLRHRRKAIQRMAAEVLALWSRVTPEVRTLLLRLLGDADLRVRWSAAFTLAKIGPEPAALGVLLDTLGEADGDMRWAAQSIVVGLARRDPNVVARLADLAATGSASQRKMAAYCLRDVGSTIPGMRETLTDALGHEDAEVRLAVLAALAGLYSSDDAVVEPLVRFFRSDPAPGVRRAAASALGKLSNVPHGSEIRAVLEEAAASDDEGLRRAAVGALRRHQEDGE